MIMLRTIEGLDALPTFAVVESHDNQVYQKAAGNKWYTPGSEQLFINVEIHLPARLLDDGL